MAVVSRGELMRLVQSVAPVAAKRSRLAIITNVLVELWGTTLVARATDLENAVENSISVGEANEDASFSLVVPPKVLIENLKGLAEQPLTLRAEGNVLKIDHFSGTLSIPCEDGADFPEFPEVPGGNFAIWPLDRFREGLRKTVWAGGKDELKPWCTGVLVDSNSERTRFVATDSHRLAVKTCTDFTHTAEIKAVLPQLFIKHLLGAKTDAISVECRFTDTEVWLRFGNTILAGRLIDCRFPDWHNVMPESSPRRTILNREEIMGSVKRLKTVANETTHLGRFRFEGNSLSIRAEDLDYGREATEDVYCLYEGEDLKIGFNLVLMETVLKMIATEDVIMEFDHPGRAAVVLPSQQEMDSDFRMLLMPVMLSNWLETFTEKANELNATEAAADADADAVTY